MAHYILFFIGCAKLSLDDDYHQCICSRSQSIAQIMQQVLFHRALNIFNEFVLSKPYFFLNEIERNKIAIDLEKKKKGDYTPRKENSASGKDKRKMSGGDGTKNCRVTLRRR